MKLALSVMPVASPRAEVRSRKVRKILKLKARVRKLLDRYARSHSRIEPLKRRAEARLDEARALELTLTGGQLGELRRARSES